MNGVECPSTAAPSVVARRRHPVPAASFDAREAWLSRDLPAAAPVRQLDLESWDGPGAKAA